jgi:methyl-accepting chemotaxis protein
MQSNSQKMTQLLEDVRERIDHTHVTAQRCGQSFESINAQIADVTHISEEIATAIEEQSKGLQEINKAIALFDQVSQQASLKAQDSSGAARDLEAQYEMLETLLRELGASVGGRSAAVCQSTESNVTRIEFKKPSSRKAA